MAWCAPGSVPELTAVVTRKVLKALSALFGLVFTLEERSLNVSKWQRRKSVLKQILSGFLPSAGERQTSQAHPTGPAVVEGLAAG